MHSDYPTQWTDPTPARPRMPSAGELGSALYLGLVAVLSLVPALATKLGPGADLADKETAFITIYLQTLPLALAMTAVCLLIACRPFEEDVHTFAAAGAIFFLSAVWGIEFAGSGLTEYGSAHIHGPVWVQAAAWGFLSLFAYALTYGWFMFVASLVVGAWAAYWVIERVQRLA